MYYAFWLPKKLFLSLHKDMFFENFTAVQMRGRVKI